MEVQRKWFDQVKDITERLVRINSISPSVAGENACAAEIKRLLTERGLSPGYWPVKSGERHNVWALLEGDAAPASPTRTPTVILLGHLDTADVQDYGAGMNPFDPQALQAALLERYQANLGTKDELLQDAASGDWLLGRGSFDMKSGVAAQIAVMGELVKMRQQLPGNVLMVSTIDEETETRGMIAAVQDLVNLREQHNLEYVGVINSDYTAPRQPGDNSRYIYQGTIGKYLACFYIRGCEVHEGEAFRGMDANLIAAGIVNEAVLDTSLCDEQDGEITVPPVTMKLRDFKVRYDAQTPIGAMVQLNILSHGSTPQDFLVKSVGLAQRVLSWANHKRVVEWTKYAKRQSSLTALEDLGGMVCTYEQLFQATRGALGLSALGLRQQLEAGVYDTLRRERALLGRLSEPERNFLIDNGRMVDIDSREISLIFVRKLVEAATRAGVVERFKPLVVVFLAPSFFPPVRSAPDSPLQRAVLEAVATGAYGEISLRSFYPYVSDISFLRMDDSFYASLPAVKANFPIWRDPDEVFDEQLRNDFYIIPAELIRRLNCDLTNIGPWGKDAHGAGERVYMPYAFETVPELIHDVILRVLGMRF